MFIHHREYGAHVWGYLRAWKLTKIVERRHPVVGGIAGIFTVTFFILLYHIVVVLFFIMQIVKTEVVVDVTVLVDVQWDIGKRSVEKVASFELGEHRMLTLDGAMQVQDILDSSFENGEFIHAIDLVTVKLGGCVGIVGGSARFTTRGNEVFQCFKLTIDLQPPSFFYHGMKLFCLVPSLG